MSRAAKRFRQKKHYEPRSIPDTAVQFCLNELTKRGVHITDRRGEILVDFLRIVLHAPKGGRIRIENYRNNEWAGKLVHDLCEFGLFECVDQDSWKPRGGSFKKSKPRAFLPSSKLLKIVFEDHRKILTFAEFLAKKDKPSRNRRRATVSTVDVLELDTPSLLIRERLLGGSGLQIRNGLAVSLIETQLTKESDRRNKLHALFRSTGNQRGELHAHWDQKEDSHRLYSPLCNIPGIVRPALQSLDQLPLWIVDYSQFEPSIFQWLCGESARDGDLRGRLLDAVNASGRGLFLEKEVKDTLNPLLHGQTKYQILYGKGTHQEKKRRALLHELLHEALRDGFPKMFARLRDLEQDPVLLQRKGARIFFDAYHAGLESTGIAAGIPMHDGWIFGATEEQAQQIQTLWQDIGLAALQIPIVAKLKQIPEPRFV